MVTFPSHLKKLRIYWDLDKKSWIVDFFTCSTREKTPQNNFSSQNFSVENNYLWTVQIIIVITYLEIGYHCHSTINWCS